MPTAAERIGNAIDNLAEIIEAKTAAWLADGCPTTYSIDGESYEWASWLETKTRELVALKDAQQHIAPKFIVRTRGRA